MRTPAPDGTSMKDLRAKAREQFPGMSATWLRFSKDEISEALKRGTLRPEAEAQEADEDPFASFSEPESADDYAELTEAPTEQPDEPKPAETPAQTEEPADLLNALSRFVQGQQAQVNPAQVEEIARKVFEELAKQTTDNALTVKIAEAPPVTLDRQHYRFPVLLTLAANRVITMLVGPTGSGKTMACANTAHALNLPFRFMSVNPMSSKSDILGFRNALGEFCSTPFAQAFENGGVFLLDEIDAGSPAVLTVLNAALSNKLLELPDGRQVEQHADFVCIAAANTFGTGADRQYVGRNQLDAATLDRFFMLEWRYDHGLTKSACGIDNEPAPAYKAVAEMKVEQWVQYVIDLCESLGKSSIRHVISPRAAMVGSRLLGYVPHNLIEEGLIWKGLQQLQRDQIINGLMKAKP